MTEPVAGGGRVGDGVLATTDFVACYQDHYRRVVRALCLAGAEPAGAEDVAQEAFARALARWRSVCRGTNPAGYVYRTAFRLLRRAERRRLRPQHDAPAPGATDKDPTTAMSVDVALASMPLRRRQCAVLCLVLGFPTADAAKVLSIAPGTVRKHLDAARQDLRHAVSVTGEGP